MPYKKAKYIHKRRRKPSEYIPESMRTVNISHVPHKKEYPAGTKAIVGKLKKDGYATQSILIPKKKR